MVTQPREMQPAQFQGAKIRMAERESQPKELVPQESDIKIRVVRHEEAVPNELMEFRQKLFGSWLVPEHLMGDAVHLPGAFGYPPVHLDEGAEFIDDRLALDGHGADLDDPVAVAGGKARRFHVKNDMAAGRVFLYLSNHGSTGSLKHARHDKR